MQLISDNGTQLASQQFKNFVYGRNIRTIIDLIKPHHTLEVNSNPHKNNLALRTLSPNDHVIGRRYGSKQKLQHGKIAERISCKMYKVLINAEIEDKHIYQI